METVGILALQGAFHLHWKKVKSLGLSCILVKTASDLKRVQALILPGGESTAMTYVLQKHNLWSTLQQTVSQIPVFATCAGVILLQKLGVLNIELRRNGYGGQLESCIALTNVQSKEGKQICLEGFFIRAPIIEKVKEPNVEILARREKKPVLLKKDKILAATFHPELCEDTFLYEYFFEDLCMISL